jgi:hypothetical protein
MHSDGVVEQHTHVPFQPSELGTKINLANGHFEKLITRRESRLTLSGFKE